MLGRFAACARHVLALDLVARIAASRRALLDAGKSDSDEPPLQERELLRGASVIVVGRSEGEAEDELAVGGGGDAEVAGALVEAEGGVGGADGEAERRGTGGAGGVGEGAEQ